MAEVAESPLDIRKLAAEAVGTALLVIFGVGTATIMFAFGLTLLVLAYVIGPVSGCHVNPAVTLGFLVGGRVRVAEALGYWAAQVVGALIGGAVLAAVFRSSSGWSDTVGLGANGFGESSMIGVGAVGAFVVEVLLTFSFVLVVLVVTRRNAWPHVAGIAVGFGLTMVHLLGIPLTGTSVNPARSLASAVFAGGDALSQLWVFLVAPMVGGALAAVAAGFLYRSEAVAPETAARAPQATTPA